MLLNEAILDNYNLEVIGIIKVSSKVYRIKTKDNKYYCLKHRENNDESIFAHLSILNINSFSLPLKNNFGKYITDINNEYFYLLNWYEEENILAKEVRLNFFIEELINLHTVSMYENKINKGYFDDIFLKLEQIIIEEENDINHSLDRVEKLEYKSPSEWLFLLNNQRFKEAINNARNHLLKFRKSIEDLELIRVSINYLNFDFTNILVKDKKIIGIDNMKICPIIYEIKELFDKSYHLSIDILMYLKTYFNKIKLLEYEKEWLLTLVSIPFINYEPKEEIDEIIDLTKTIYHLNRGKELEKILEEYK